MVNKWDNEWERDSQVYTERQVEGVLEDCGVEITGQTTSHFQAYCPFHHNTEDPAFVVDKQLGLFLCFNPSCAESGTLQTLIRRTKGANQFQAYRTILKHKNADAPLRKRYEEVRKNPPKFLPFPQEPVARMQRDFLANYDAREYMRKRKFQWETLEYFGIGYSTKRDMIIVPMYAPDGMLVGFVGRSIEGKIFKNSDGLPKSKTAWNFQHAKRHGDVVIVTESAFDAMRVHQSGYPNVVALLGGSVSEYHLDELGKTFSTVIIATDFDKRIYRPNCRICGHECQGHRPGRDLGRKIAAGLPTKRIKWAAYNDEVVYPHGAKDMGDLTDEEIIQCLHNAVGQFEYAHWNPEAVDD